ncbi:hypothetical protein [[Clostridium] dakarense]|uniref:hypothetical protein n=1 Tax=Faecalimicrobium dakarense TaxID=1301100 RepID=UPI0004AFD158|nr:hypothetical protein [[Clostridium] dakarense]
MGENVVTFISIMPVVIIFIGMGIYSLKRKTPMHFWAGTVVKPEEIRDIKSYNRANGIMWIVYGLSFLLCIPLELLFGDIGYIIIGILGLPGVIALILCYNHIYKKYKNDTNVEKNSSTKKYERIVFSFIMLVCLIPCIILATVDVTGGHELTIKDDKVRMQMTSFKMGDIKNIELLEDINITSKITGSGTFIYSRGAYNVEGEEATVYLYKGKKPYIKIKLKNDKIIYYNEKNREDTEKTYNKLLQYIK